MKGFRRSIAALAGVCGAACSPVLDWREFVPEGTDIAVSFPCRPDRHARSVTIGGTTVRMAMLVCSAGGATYALSFFDVADPARVGPTLSAWRATAIDNVRGHDALVAPWQVPGMTSNEQAVRASFAGTLPDGAAVREQAAFFPRGMRLYQAAVVGQRPDAADVEVFFAALKFPT